jgi:hypothetical protein
VVVLQAHPVMMDINVVGMNPLWIRWVSVRKIDQIKEEIKDLVSDDEYSFPDAGLVDFVRDVFDRYPIIESQCHDISYDGETGILLFLENELTICVWRRCFFPSVGQQMVKRYYREDEIDQMLIDYGLMI